MFPMFVFDLLNVCVHAVLVAQVMKMVATADGKVSSVAMNKDHHINLRDIGYLGTYSGNLGNRTFFNFTQG
jgi:hypothetical protein